ncbi:MAG: sigma-70 family RNA polymerase sigma factor [Lachnospiraceae bacterium]|nr:sigma-70 family RNA polymerase sigma factor [Lachnospiraceae bacterium]
MQDKDIIDLYFARDEAAIAGTQEKYGPYCCTVAYNIVASREDAEECVNDTYKEAWDRIPPTRPKYLKLFLAKITRSKAFDKWRMMHAEKRRSDETALVLEELSDCVSGGTDPVDEVMSKELSGIINGFLRDLPARERKIFLRRYFYSEKVKDIAKDAGMTESAVSVMLHRIREKLKDHLEREGHLI